MRGSVLTGSLECWRGSGEEEMPVDVAVSLRVYAVHPSEGRGFEVDLLSAVAAGAPVDLTDAELQRAVEQFTESA